MGENDYFMPRNNSIFAFILQAGAGTVGFTDAHDGQTVCGPFTGPNSVSSNWYTAAGYFDGRGTGDWITAPTCDAASGGSGIAFRIGTLANAPSGALTTILHVNFMETDAYENSQALTRNLISYVGEQVTVSPEPGSIVLLATGLGALGMMGRKRVLGMRST